MIRSRGDIVLNDAVEARRLSGLSGAQVFLVTKDTRHWFVRKVAVSAEASPRLRAQAAKQRAFAALALEGINAPAILDEGEIEGRYYFDMEFVRGVDGATFLRRATYGEVAAFADRLSGYIRHAATSAPLHNSPSATLFDALYAKLCEVQRKTQLVSGESLARMFLSLDRLRRATPDVATLCHGDLTLQNLVVAEDGRLWLIDELDAPFEHWWQDVAKLHQDLSGGWFLLEQEPVAQCVLDYVGKRLLATAAEIDPRFPRFHPLMMASVFVRILPYAPSEEHVQFITDRIDYFAALCPAD